MPRIPDPQAKFSRIPESNKPKKKKSRISASRFPHVGSSVSIHSIILLIQISMNASPLIPFVTSMLIAPILKDPISVPVRPDSLVMAKPAKV